jgi:hypothetical protein
MAKETLTSLRQERDALTRRIDELYESKIRMVSALAMAKRILEDALERDPDA